MIHLISKDLRKEEVYVQIADCIDYLERITNESFDKVNNKLKSMSNDLVDIERRREIVKRKIEEIKKNSNKAIQISSPFYYPAKHLKDQHKFESLIDQPSKPDKNRYEPPAINQPPKYNIKQSLELFHPDDLNDHLNFLDIETFFQTLPYERENLHFLQRQKLDKSTIQWNRIKSISSLIIFNSSETAYIKSDQDSSIYDFKTANKQKKAEESDEFDFANIAPPKSMAKREQFQYDNLFKMEAQEAPKVLENLPNDLPELGAVADDIFFKDDFSVPSISVNQSDEKVVPRFETYIFEKPVEKQFDDCKSIPIPPPLPDPRSSIASSEVPKIETKVEKKTLPIDESRANLLDAIRKAGGKPDKSKVTIKEKKLEERKNRKEPVSTDLMSDLKKHLLSRRQAMTGAKSGRQDNPSKMARKENPQDVYSSINKKIPSPQTSSESSEDSSDDDWVNG